MSTYKEPDHYSRKAQAMGYAARSAFKLEQLAGRHDILRRGGRYLDLGCRPGSWSQWIRAQLGADCRILGVDLEPCDGFPGAFLRISAELLRPEQVLEALGGPPDFVLSDMAPATSGARDLDHLRQIALAERALDLALGLLPEGGGFVVKVFDGRDAPAFVRSLQENFRQVRRHKPPATRSNSREFFLVAEGRRVPVV